MLVDLFAVGFLVLLEGLLSFDNALALAAMVRHLPESQRQRALTYGMVGAFVFRVLALSIVTYLMTATWVKVVGGGYLAYLCASYFFKKESDPIVGAATARAFWGTVVMVELTDIAFSIDSILAAVAISPKLWVVVLGGIFGIIAMRFVASLFIQLIEQFPKLERSAYILVGIVGAKLLVEAVQTYSGSHVLDFDEISNPAFWVLWLSMTAGLVSGLFR